MKMRVLWRLMPSVGFHPLQELERLLRLLGLVALIVLPENLVGRGFDDDGLHRRRADVESDKELGLLVM